jgi:hypothetical protein
MGTITRGYANLITADGPNAVASGSIQAADLASGVGGKVLQVVTATDSTQRTTSSTTFVTASNTLSVSITPSSSSNNVFVLVTNGGQGDGSVGRYTIYRNSTNLGNGNSGMYSSGGNEGSSNTTISILDTPATTSTITYQVYLRSEGGNTAYSSFGNVKASITAFEIAG